MAKAKSKKVLKLSDDSIAQIVRLLQVALLTGTDVSDNLRMLELVEEDGSLNVEPAYLEQFDANLQKIQDDFDSGNALKKKPGFA